MSTAFAPPLEMFYHWETAIPDQAWLIQPKDGHWIDYSWSNVGQECRRMAGALQALGLQRGDRVGIYAVNSARWVMADMAIMMAGGVSVPIYSSMPEDKLRYVVEHSEITILFADDSGAMSLDVLSQRLSDRVKVISMADTGGQENWKDLQGKFDPVVGSPVREPGELWSISYTSGTTGMPKGVMHSFETMPVSASELHYASKADENARFFSYLPLAHMAERCVVELHSLYSGASITFNESRETFTQDLQKSRPTFFFAVPRIWHNLKAGIIAQMGEETWARLLENPVMAREAGKEILTSMGLEQVTFGFSGSAPIAPADIEAWLALGMPFCEGYGMTENMTATCNRLDDYKVGSVGKLVSADVEMMLSDQDEILFRSKANMLGYYKEPEKTAETLAGGWLHTGDKGRIDEDGFLFITGRVKDIFKTAKGKYVAPAPIEQKFSEVSHFEQLCLVGRGMPQTVLLVVLTPQAQQLERKVLAEELNAALQMVNGQLEAHEKMSHMIVCREGWTIENKMLTHTLKILRDDVEEKLRPTIDFCVNGEIERVVWE